VKLHNFDNSRLNSRSQFSNPDTALAKNLVQSQNVHEPSERKSNWKKFVEFKFPSQ